METGWRALLETRGPIPPEAEALAGDIDLLVPIREDFRALDLSAGCGARAEVLAHRCRQVVAVVHDPLELPALEARGAAHPAGPDRIRPMSAGSSLPFEGATFDLVVLDDARPWRIEQVAPLLKPGGWLVWLLSGAPIPSVGRSSFGELFHGARALTEWAQQRLSAPTRRRAQLNGLGFEDCRIYIHVREYAWGYLPFDAYWLQRYYLESMQEEAQGDARGKARLARLLGKGGVYPFLASAHVAVARLQEDAT